MPEGWENLPLGMRWPASQLSWANMSRLTRISNQMRRPITKVLRDAVEMYCDAKLGNPAVSEVASMARNDLESVEPIGSANRNNRIPQSNSGYLFDMVAEGDNRFE